MVHIRHMMIMDNDGVHSKQNAVGFKQTTQLSGLYSACNLHYNVIALLLLL